MKGSDPVHAGFEIACAEEANHVGEEVETETSSQSLANLCALSACPVGGPALPVPAFHLPAGQSGLASFSFLST